MQELSELENNSNKYLELEKQLIELKDLIELAHNEKDEDVISSCKLDLDIIYLKLESIEFKSKKNKEYSYQGGVYVGDWVNGKPSGQGKIYEYTSGTKIKNGNTYEGSWLNSKRHGNGKLVMHKWDIDMAYVKVRFIGKGRSILLLNSECIYEGNWVDDKASGVGKFIWKNGDVFEGNFANNIMFDGKITYKNGKIEFGKFGNRGKWRKK